MKKFAIALALAAVMSVLSVPVNFAADPPSPLPTPSPVQTPAAINSPGAEDYPTFGITITPPTGWKHMSEGGVNRIVRLVKVGEGGKIEAMLQVEHARIGDTLEQEMRKLVKEQGATSVKPVQVDGEVGGWAKGSMSKGPGTPVATQLLVTDHANVRYVIALFRDKPGAPGEDDALLKDFIDHWKFRQIVEPARYINFMNQSLPVLGGAMRINVPINARPDVVEDPRTQVHFALINLKTQDDEFRVRVGLRALPMGTLGEFGNLLKQKLGFKDDLQWTRVTDNATMCTWVQVQISGRPVWMSFGVVPLSDKQVAIATFTIDREEPEVQKAYSVIAQKILSSIGPGSAPQVATPVNIKGGEKQE